jgi:Fur family ferric uptake transcriptional regulator
MTPAQEHEHEAHRDAARERSTRQKRALGAVLAGSDAFMSAQDLHIVLRERGEHVGLTTVYNQLRSLAEAGEVDVLRADDGESLYRRCHTEVHHHHLSCRVCGRAVEVEGPEVEAWAEGVGKAHGYRELTHTLEIIGTCSDCAKLAAT